MHKMRLTKKQATTSTTTAAAGKYKALLEPEKVLNWVNDKIDEDVLFLKPNIKTLKFDKIKELAAKDKPLYNNINISNAKGTLSLSPDLKKIILFEQKVDKGEVLRDDTREERINNGSLTVKINDKEISLKPSKYVQSLRYKTGMGLLFTGDLALGQNAQESQGTLEMILQKSTTNLEDNEFILDFNFKMKETVDNIKNLDIIFETTNSNKEYSLNASATKKTGMIYLSPNEPKEGDNPDIGIGQGRKGKNINVYFLHSQCVNKPFESIYSYFADETNKKYVINNYPYFGCMGNPYNSISFLCLYPSITKSDEVFYNSHMDMNVEISEDKKSIKQKWNLGLVASASSISMKQDVVYNMAIKFKYFNADDAVKFSGLSAKIKSIQEESNDFLKLVKSSDGTFNLPQGL